MGGEGNTRWPLVQALVIIYEKHKVHLGIQSEGRGVLLCAEVEDGEP